MNQQICKVCGRPDKFNFHVPDDIWDEVIPQKFRNKVVCLCCFDELAHSKGIKYHNHLDNELYFAGKQAIFIFNIATKLGN
jgi:hypothetical protein